MAKRRQPTADDRLKWWREARFGMFIHWGLYALPAGLWHGREMPYIGEWIQSYFRIPGAEYGRLAEKFNPVDFDADEWVRIAKDAGMKYIVITSKHHDGFAMYDSAASDYNIVAATPYGRDPLKALAAACRKAGMRLGFYYSQSLDWREEDAGGTEEHLPLNAGMSWGNNWDFPDNRKKNYARFLRDKVKPQLRELLTQYGPVALIWFDCPYTITPAQSRELKRFVHRLQPDCLVSGRVGHDVGDYGSMGDNEIPCGPVVGDWETPGTLNNTWGFKKNDRQWQSTRGLLHLLVDLASKGANYLLNVGPTAKGVIPAPSVKRLAEIGRWLAVNGEAVYGSRPTPFPHEHEWGRITCRGKRLYLLFTDWPAGRFVLRGLRNRVRSARLLACPSARLAHTQSYDAELDLRVLELRLPRRAPDRHVAVALLELDGPAEADLAAQQQPSGLLALPAAMAQLHTPATGRRIGLSRSGIVVDWHNKKSWLSWEAAVPTPGAYSVDVVLGSVAHGAKVVGGHRVSVTVGRSKLTGVLRGGEDVTGARAQYFRRRTWRLGTIQVDRVGRCVVKLRALTMPRRAPMGLSLAELQLRPVAQDDRSAGTP